MKRIGTSTEPVFYVYAHYTADTAELFYVGKGKGRRSIDRSGRSRFWRSIVEKHGIRVEILHGNLSEQEAYDKEVWAIEQHKPRANLTKGGTGGYTGPNSGQYKPGTKPWNTGKICPNISAQQLGERNPMYGKPSRRVPVKCLTDGLVFPSIRHAAEHYGIMNSLVFRCLQGVLKATHGLQFVRAANA